MGAKTEHEGLKKKKKLSVCSILVLSISVWWYSHKNRDLQTLYT